MAGELFCWGSTDYGKPYVPYAAPGSAWIAVSAGGYHICGILADSASSPFGQLKCWGDAAASDVPARLQQLNWTAVAVGSQGHTCGILHGSSELACWGDDVGGKATVPTGYETARWIKVAAGFHHTCAILETGEMMCWGEDGNGQTDVPPTVGPWSDVTAGGYHTCGISTSDKRLHCWGDFADGQLNVPNPETMWSSVAAGYLQNMWSGGRQWQPAVLGNECRGPN